MVSFIALTTKSSRSAESSLPSVEAKPTTIRKLAEDLVTVRPEVCTMVGNCEVTSCSLFCTCICATSGSARLVKVRRISTSPVDSDEADMYCRLSTPVMPCSITRVTEFSTVRASAPG
ncbi:hypothetical protein BUGL105410_29305 [Burkholderia gladioli]